MGFFGLEVDCLRSTETLQKQSAESRKFPSVPVTSDSIFVLHIIFRNKNRSKMGLMFALMITLYFYSSLWIYAFIHKIPVTSFDSNIHY